MRGTLSSPYVVRHGDTLALIARMHGISSWQDLFYHPDNAGLRASRPNPDRIYPGDVVMIPEVRIGAVPRRLRPGARVHHVHILAAIDGTNSADCDDKPNKSHVFRFYNDFRTSDMYKHYEDGPDTAGFKVTEILGRVCDFLTKCLKQAPDARVSLVGHSRGGLVALLAAKRLGVPVHFLGLYDAVDMQMKEGCKVIPGNVKTAYHAMRDPSVHSRRLWGNAGKEADSRVDYHHKLFKATHGSIGGDPQGSEEAESRDTAIATGVVTALGVRLRVW